MKYIMVFHANLHYSGLRPEKYEFVIRKSYERIFDLFATLFKGQKFCFEASGFTLDMMAKITPDVVKRLREAMDRSDCEFMGSPYAHSIMTNFPYEAQQAYADLTRTDFKQIPSTEINPSMG